MKPAEPVDCNLNIANSEKKVQGSSRMNINARHYNKGANQTRYHVTTPQEARHRLKGAKVYSEFNKGSQVIVQAHLGLHWRKGRFLEPMKGTGIFHHARGRGGQHDAVQGEEAGLTDLVKDVGAGAHQNMTEDKRPGPDQNVIKDELAGPNGT